MVSSRRHPRERESTILHSEKAEEVLALSRLRHGLTVRWLAATVTAAVLAVGCTPPSASRDGGAAATNPSGKAIVSAPDTGYTGTLLDDLPRPALRLRTVSHGWFDLQARPAGEATVVFFGFTHCSDVCPTTMADLAGAYRQLSPQTRRDVTVVFVTEDPRRDTPTVLRGWLDGFEPAFVGLIGGGQRTAAVLKQLYAPVSRINPDPDPAAIEHPPGHDHGQHSGGPDDDYGIDHTGNVYVFGPDGRTLLYTGNETPSDYAADLSRLVG